MSNPQNFEKSEAEKVENYLEEFEEKARKIKGNIENKGIADEEVEDQVGLFGFEIYKVAQEIGGQGQHIHKRTVEEQEVMAQNRAAFENKARKVHENLLELLGKKRKLISIYNACAAEYDNLMSYFSNLSCVEGSKIVYSG